MKGISPMLSLALTILLTTSATVLVLTTLKPTLDKAKAYSIFNEGIQNLELLSSAIKEVASEAEGSKRTISISVSDGEYKINSAYDWLYFEYDPPTDLGLAGRRGSIWIERGLEFADWFNGYAENSLPYSFYNLSGSWKIVNERLEGEKGLAFFNLSKKLPGFSFSANLENSDGQGEVFVSPVNPQNLTLFLSFDEGSGTIAYDFSGNENNGTLYNGSTICSGQDCPNWVDGKFGKALSFDGINDYVEVLLSSGLPIYYSSAFSVEMWVKGAPQSGNYLYAEGNSSTDTPTWGFYTQPVPPYNKLKVIVRDDAGTIILDKTFTKVIFDNNWHHIVYVDNQGNVSLYVDGTLDDTATYVRGTLTLNKASIAAQSRTTVESFFNGTIDEVRIYNRALSEEEIKAEYEAGIKKLSSSGTQTIFSTFSPYLVLSNPFGKTYFDSIRVNSNYKKLNLIIPFSRIDLNGTFRVSRGTHDIIIENKGFNSTSNKPIIQVTAS